MTVIYIIAVIIMLVYFAAPIPIKLIMLGANLILPDFILYVDEILMVAGVLIHIMKRLNILSFIVNHIRGIVISIVVLLVAGVTALFIFFYGHQCQYCH